MPTSTQHSQQSFPPLSPSLTGHVPSVDATGVPMRHPRPLTAAELHLELEKEQEAVVNRLTRELSALRAHSASVASTASSNASGAPGLLLDATDPSAAHTGALMGPTHPTTSRRHRSSSSVSRGSVSASYNGPTTFTTGIPLGAASAGIAHQHQHQHQHHRYSASSQPAGAPQAADAPSGQGRASSVVSTPRYEEVAHYRQELEEAKRENELLRRRIRELERVIRGRRSSSSETGPRGRRSESALGSAAGGTTVGTDGPREGAAVEGAAATAAVAAGAGAGGR